MSLTRRDREFRIPKVSYFEYKQLEMDRVLTGLFSRLAHNGQTSRIKRKKELKIDEFVSEFIEHPEWFKGFDQHRDTVERWVETHLMDVVNRGKSDQAIAAPRPLHGYTYRFRNPKHARDYGASQQIYESLYWARSAAGQKAIEHLKEFLFKGHDKVTGKFDADAQLDVETQALLRLLDQVQDAPDKGKERDSHAPLCVGLADLMAEDIQRILLYQNYVPRTVMIDYLKILLSFHLALYHLRLIKLLPLLVRRKGGDPICDPKACPMQPKQFSTPQGDCPYQMRLFVDIAGDVNSPCMSLAAQSADEFFRRIPQFVSANFTVRKLYEFAGQYLERRKGLSKPAQQLTVGEILELLGPMYKKDRDKFFGQRVASILEDSSGAEGDIDPEIQRIMDLGLPEFDSYIEILSALRGKFHRTYIVQCLDSILLKNKPGALISQGKGKKAPRRFVLDSRLLEVLVQLAVLKPGGKLGYHSGELRVDELLSFLRERYGLYIDVFPENGLGKTSVEKRKLLRLNRQSFTQRLREIGFYQDLSDAYLVQTVTPRYKIEKGEEG